MVKTTATVFDGSSFADLGIASLEVRVQPHICGLVNCSTVKNLTKFCLDLYFGPEARGSSLSEG